MPKKLLLADDSITIQKVVGITLANEDLEITSVDNGEDAIARARTLRPDLVLADASMPKKDGYQVAEALKADPTTSMIPVLILAGQLEGHPDQGRLTACRADGFIPKPFESQQLIDRVRKLLGLAGPVTVAVPPPAPAIRPAAAAPVAAPAPRPMPAPMPVAAPAPRPMPAAATPVAAPRPMPAAAPIAAPRPAPAPMPAPAPAPMPAPAPAAAPMMATSSIDETDFGELSSSPAASGDTSLWGDAPVGTVPDEALWGGGGPDTPANGAPAAMVPIPSMAEIPPSSGLAPDDAPMDMVTNPAEMANLDKFHGDDSPSGLELDPDAPKARPRDGDDQLSTGPVPGAPVPSITPIAAPAVAGAGVSPDLASAIAMLPPEKLEQIVREAVAKALQPIIEKIAWEVVPDLAEDLIKDEIKRLTQ